MNRHLRAAREAIEAAAGHLPVDVIARRSGDRWCIAEILEHLTLAFTANAAALEKALASGEPRARRPSWTQTLARILVVDGGYFPAVKAPEMTVPTGAIPPERILEAIRSALEQLDDTLTRVAARFGADVPVANHPYFAGLTVAQWRRFHRRHTIHHMSQVRRRLPPPDQPGQTARSTDASR